MAQSDSKPDSSNWHKVSAAQAQQLATELLSAAGADTPSATAVARSLVGASLRGVDSHGIRLLPHYLAVLRSGRINPAPELSFTASTAVAGVVNCDDGFGHLGGYRAVEEGIKLAQRSGLGLVSVINSSHFGPAGSYALAGAEAGYICLVMSNSDSLVLAHDGTQPFHGTNPVSLAAPLAGEKPYLIDMASSSLTLNRVLHYRSLGHPLPADIAVNDSGQMTTDAAAASALLPLGGTAYGFKGAALAGMIEIFCCALSGMAFSHQLIPFHGDDISSRRHLGQTYLLIKPDLFIPQQQYQQHLRRYLDDLRSQPSQPGTEVMAPGDREWQEQRKRESEGIPVDPQLQQELSEIAAQLKVAVSF